MQTKRLLWIVALGLGLAMTLAVLVALGLSPEVVRAASKDWFVKAGSTGTCTQVDPCALQTALADAGNGDTIYVAGGTYTGTGAAVITVTKSITLYGGWDGVPTGPVIRDPAVYSTILDGENGRRVVYIIGNIGPILEGLRLTNGSVSDDGGGICSRNAHPLINNCWIYGNVANQTGGGIYLYSPYSSDNATLTNNNIYSNTAHSTGGGISLLYSDYALLEGNSIYSNTSPFQGGGIYLNFSDNVMLTTNRVFTNTMMHSTGGGVCVRYSDDTTLRDNEISHNAGLTGGGIGILDSQDVTLMNNMLLENQATVSVNNGAGISVRNSDVRILHTTIARNAGGNGICVDESGTVAMTNTILVSHTVGIRVNGGSTATLEGTLWGDGAWANTTDWGGAGHIATGTVNVRGDPAFVNPDSGDYHIGPGSAAIDAGVDAGVLTDIDGDPRPIGPLPDLGADEFCRKVYLPLVLR